MNFLSIVIEWLVVNVWIKFFYQNLL